MTKRLFIIFAAVLLALVLSACGNSCDSYDSQGWCCTNTGAGKMVCSK